MSEQRSGQGGFSTRAIHAGQEPDASTGAVITPIYQVSTYKQDGIGGFRGGYEYSRSANPTRTALEECFAALEGGARGFAFASGLAGQDTRAARPAPARRPRRRALDAYGGTYRLFNKVLVPWGVEHTIAPMGDIDAVRAAIRPGQTKMRLGRDADQPAARHRRHRGARRPGPRGRRPPRRRQHLRLALPPAAAGARRRHRHATRPRSTAAATATSSAARSSSAATSPSRASRTRRIALPSTRTRWAPWPGRSTPGSSCAA